MFRRLGKWRGQLSRWKRHCKIFSSFSMMKKPFSPEFFNFKLIKLYLLYECIVLCLLEIILTRWCSINVFNCLFKSSSLFYNLVNTFRECYTALKKQITINERLNLKYQRRINWELDGTRMPIWMTWCDKTICLI